MAGPATLFDTVPDGFRGEPEFISPAEEQALLDMIERMEFREVRMRGVAARRRVRQFGWKYSFETHRLTGGDRLPDFLAPLQERSARLAGVDPEALSEALVTEYQPGAAIGWHRDAPAFGIVVGISLRAACTFRLRRGAGGERPLSIDLPPRSAYVLDGSARTEWQHSIPAVKQLRYSVTFRTLRGRPAGPRPSAPPR